MSVPLRQEAHGETSLVLFTLFVPASVGMACCALVFGGGFPPASMATLLATAGMACSVLHLAKPLRAPASLLNLRSSWLSREIAAVSVFWAFLVVWLAGEWFCLPAIWLPGRVLSAAFGIALLAIIARAYKVSTRPAWQGCECFAELVACALGTGITLTAALKGELSGNLWIPVVLIGGIGLALDIFSHRNRKRRLEALRCESDERMPLTLAQYGKLWPQVRIAWGLEAAAVMLAAVAPWLADLSLPLWCTAVALQAASHGLHRAIFYALPVQVRYVARLRK